MSKTSVGKTWFELERGVDWSEGSWSERRVGVDVETEVVVVLGTVRLVIRDKA